MDARPLDRLRALILVLTAMFAADQIVSGSLFDTIAPRLGWMIGLTIAILLLAAGAHSLGRQAAEAGLAAPGVGAWGVATVLFVALPPAIGVIMPPNQPGALETGRTGVVTKYGGSHFAGTIRAEPASRSVLDWASLFAGTSDAQVFDEQRADVTGFVYRDSNTAANQFVLIRWVMACCSPDAQPVGIVVQSDIAARYEVDSWVRVTGSFSSGKFGEEFVPVLHAADILPVQRPEQPLLYP